MTIDRAMGMALEQQRLGNLAEAQNICRQILAKAPGHPGALHLLGLLALTSGQAQQAVELIRQAISIHPREANYYLDLGRALRSTGRMDEAIEAYSAAIRLRPDMAETYNNLGNAFNLTGRRQEAIAAYTKAIGLKPDLAEAYNNLGNVLGELGRVDEALQACATAVRLRPMYAEAHNSLGNALRSAKRLEAALGEFREAARIKKDLPEAHNNVGMVLNDLRRGEEAVSAYLVAIAVKPDYFQAYSNMGNVLRDHGRIDEAIAAHRRSIQINPNYAEAHSNLGNALCDLGQIELALAESEAAVKLKPDSGEAHFNLGQILLLRGDFGRGWAEHEWRWRAKTLTPPRNYVQPQWDGGALAGRTILLHGEQGLGDTIQFARYAPLVAGRGAKVIMECQAPLKRLLQQIPGVQSVYATGESLPPFDLHCPLMSLPLAFGTMPDNIPAKIPYLKGDHRTMIQGRGPHIGLAWAGNPRHENDRHRSMPLQQLAALARASATFHSLQIAPPGSELAGWPEFKLIDHSSSIGDFVDTTALIQGLDLVISVDTSVAHLAGAMGKPVWLLLPFAPDWRWLLDREDSPWYPSMRLFRQRRAGDWGEVVERVGSALQGEFR